MKLNNMLSHLWTYLAILVAATPAVAQAPVAKDRSNLMVVVRESQDGDKKDEILRPTGKMTARLADGKEVEFEMASWEFIGDTHIRFVFDGPTTMTGATPGELAQLGLGRVEDALALALENVKRIYGAPSSSPWSDGVMEVSGKSADMDSTYFLDRDFWRTLLNAHPDGIVVAVPKRGGLLYAPVSNAQAVNALKRSIAQLHATSGSARVSGALFLFKGDQWSVLQAAAGR